MRQSNILLAFIALVIIAPNAMATEQLFGQLDQNQDGSIASNEIDSQHRRLFDRLLRTADSDRDGQLTRAEFQTSLQSRPPAKPLVEKQGSELPGADALLLLLARMDRNSNGRIEEDEVPQPLVEVFQRIEDRVGGKQDGVLDRRELTQAGPALSQIALRIAQRMDLDVELELALLPEKQWRSVQNMIGPRQRGDALADPQQAREFFQRLDANSDGQITFAEVPEQIADRFEQLLERADRNRDEQISERELMTVSRQLQAMAANRPSPAELQKGIDRLLKRLDKNDDRKLSPQETPRRMASRFERLDRDGSGQLEGEELTTIVEILSRVRRPEFRQQSADTPKMSQD